MALHAVIRTHSAGVGGRSLEDPLEGLGFCREVLYREEVVAHALARGRAEPPGPCRVVEDPSDRLTAGGDVGGIVDQQSTLVVHDLVLDPADARGDDRALLPHGLGHGEAEAFDEALLDNDVGSALYRVHDGRVLLDVVHRDPGEVNPGVGGSAGTAGTDDHTASEHPDTAHRTANDGTADHRTADHRTADHRTADHRTADHDGTTAPDVTADRDNSSAGPDRPDRPVLADHRITRLFGDDESGGLRDDDHTRWRRPTGYDHHDNRHRRFVGFGRGDAQRRRGRPLRTG
jgi:hypothetical protein